MCDLAIDANNYQSVARAKVFGSKVLHNLPIGPDNVKVSIIIAKVKNAPLPFPSDELKFVKDAIGTFIAWPKSLLIMDTKV
jgi:hypothetical protein